MTRDEEAATDPRLFDRRIVERNIRRGVITRKDYEKFLKSLDDASDKIAPADRPTAEPEAAPAETGSPSDTSSTG
jgi:hypothetical protein